MMAVSPEIFKQVLSGFCSGVTVVTLKSETGLHGITVSAFSSLSLDPPLILVCIAKNGSSHKYLSASEDFVVNLLSEGQEDLCMKFANPELTSEERFGQISYRINGNGIVVFDDVLGYLECKKINEFDGGDHTIFVGKVEHAGVAKQEKRPLVYYNRSFYDLKPK